MKRIYAWPRVRFALAAAGVVGLLLAPGWTSGLISVIWRCVAISLGAVTAFGVCERWPRRLPRWLQRWAFQVVAVALVGPAVTFAIFVVSTRPGDPAFWRVPERFQGFWYLTILGVLVAPWSALAALVRQKDLVAKQAIEARHRLLRAQIAPHFLFNSLANVQALVDAGSTDASRILRSLTTYLRGAVPRLDDELATVGDEVDLVRAYLEVMHMRMPDRLEYAVNVDERALSIACPPISLLTLVENAVRHGIDPTEDGGRIDVTVAFDRRRCLLRVVDTGVGLPANESLCGTGIATLRERLEVVFAGTASLRIGPHEPRGVRAELELPAPGVE